MGAIGYAKESPAGRSLSLAGVLHAASPVAGMPGYTTVVRSDGTGWSLGAGLAVTAGSSGISAGREGLQVFVRDLDSGRFWAVGDPGPDAACEARWDPGLFTIDHQEDGLQAVLEVSRAPEGLAEWRRATVRNLGGRPRRVDVTSLAEIVLNHAAAHAAHPVFSKLFLQTRRDPASGALLVGRRPRDPQDRYPWVCHALLGAAADQCETDRARFSGRGRPRSRPAALAGREPLSGTVGNVLDPVVSLRRALELAPGQAATLDFVLGVGADPDTALALSRQKVGTPAETAALDRRSRRASPADQALAEQLAAAVLAGDPDLWADPVVLARAGGNPDSLQRLGLPAGKPLMLLVVPDAAAPLVATAQKLAKHWQILDLPLETVILCGGQETPESEAGLHWLSAGSLTDAQKDLLAAKAAWVCDGDLPQICAQPCRFTGDRLPRIPEPRREAPSAPPEKELLFPNGTGGFSTDGREYVMRIASGPDGSLGLPPRPWTNILANEKLGCIVSETGAGCTWAGNSREHRLTPWANDPVLDPHDEALYLRDEEDGGVFSCWPGPRPGIGIYEVAHGFGYSRCRRWGDGLETQTTVFVGPDDPVRLTRVRVTNTGPRARRISLWSYQHLVLGGLASETASCVVTERDEPSGALLARNATAGPFARQVAFAAAQVKDPGAELSFSCDARSFLGEGGDPAAPAALTLPALDGKVGAGLPPCFAHQVILNVAAGQTVEVVFLLGQEEDLAAARRLVSRLADPDEVEAAWTSTTSFWHDWHDILQIETPSPALDLMVNGWLGYQTVACRLWGRSALYQSGGAFGYRDQLQDSLALLAFRPELTRDQILLHAGHQFLEGDVLHWWHPPLDRGIRTRFADDYLWLPFALLEYLNATGDESLLDAAAPYLKAPLLADGQDEVFLQAEPSGQSGTVYEHCCRALDRALVCGEHGLPLFGTGDWNDGMNRVGREGRGESVWMGFFLVTIIDGFLSLCEARGDGERAARYAAHRDDLIRALNDTGWDGGWYRRGYYDDGTPLGSWENKECAIDALAQAWSVLSGVASPLRAAQVMDAVEEHLISPREGLIRLLTPPFVDTPQDPGYIKGYVAGVRENGGQYTHAALWVVRAMAALGRRDRAAALLDLINPVLHTATAADVARYQVEPYVVAADVYGAPPHVGRGGWTWYTGSSSWMLRTAVESVLGLLAEGSVLSLTPCIPDHWPGYRLKWRVPGGSGTCYEVEVRNPELCSEEVVEVVVDGKQVMPVSGRAKLPLLRDGAVHRVALTLGPQSKEKR